MIVDSCFCSDDELDDWLWLKKFSDVHSPINYAALGQHGLPKGGNPGYGGRLHPKKQHLLLEALRQKPMIFVKQNELTRIQWLLLQQVTSPRCSQFPMLKIKAISEVLFMVSWQIQ